MVQCGVRAGSTRHQPTRNLPRTSLHTERQRPPPKPRTSSSNRPGHTPSPSLRVGGSLVCGLTELASLWPRTQLTSPTPPRQHPPPPAPGQTHQPSVGAPSSLLLRRRLVVRSGARRHQQRRPSAGPRAWRTGERPRQRRSRRQRRQRHGPRHCRHRPAPGRRRIGAPLYLSAQGLGEVPELGVFAQRVVMRGVRQSAEGAR